MFTIQNDCFETINESLTGARPTDEETYSSVAVLAERLERLKQNSTHFGDIELSPHVEELASREMISAIS